MNIQRTPHGFDWNCAKIECLASDNKKGWMYLGVTTPKDCIEIYITKSGKMRVYNAKRNPKIELSAKDSTNKKELT